MNLQPLVSARRSPNAKSGAWGRQSSCAGPPAHRRKARGQAGRSRRIDLVAPQFTSAIAASDAGISARSARTQKANSPLGSVFQLNTSAAMIAVVIADDGEIAGDPGRRVRSNEPSSDRAMKSQVPFKCRAPFRDEVMAWITLASRGRFILAGASSLARFAASSASRVISSSECLEPRASSSIARPVAIPSWEIHCGKVALGAQHRIDQADALDDLLPIDGGHQAHARDDVADCHVDGALPLMLLVDNVVGRRSLRGQALVQTGERRHSVGS